MSWQIWSLQERRQRVTCPGFDGTGLEIRVDENTSIEYRCITTAQPFKYVSHGEIGYDRVLIRHENDA